MKCVFVCASLAPAGDIPAAYMPWVLRIAAACSHTSGGDSQAAMADISRGISTWRASLNRGLLPDDEAIQQLLRNGEPFTRGAARQPLGSLGRQAAARPSWGTAAATQA